MSSRFSEGVDAVASGGSGLWFFRQGRALETNGSGDKRLHEPDSLTSEGYWPALRGTGFENGIDAVTAGDSSGFWFFKDGKTLKTDKWGSTREKGPVDIAVEWPALEGTGFETGVDAVTVGGNGLWFFKGDRALETNGSGDKRLHEPDSLTSEGYWPALRGTGFENGIDAVTAGDSGGFWFFKDGKTLKTDKWGSTREKGPVDIAVEWPALDV
ncbi:hypothetical protein [Streptomyces sp. 058-1L]|uniref:hypothetical protein n=1 Tax=Streptomyces sp. 058-1L TaxID=2789266 RepID=UPI00397F3E8D